MRLIVCNLVGLSGLFEALKELYRGDVVRELAIFD